MHPLESKDFLAVQELCPVQFCMNGNPVFCKIPEDNCDCRILKVGTRFALFSKQRFLYVIKVGTSETS